MNTIKTIYFVIEGSKYNKGKKALNIYKITQENIIPQRISQISYTPASTRGRESEVVQFLVDSKREIVEGWTDSSYYSSYKELDFQVIINGYILEL